MEKYKEAKEKQIKELTKNIKAIYVDSENVDDFIRAVSESTFELTKDNFYLLECIVLGLDAGKLSLEDVSEDVARIIAEAVEYFGGEQ